MTRAKGYRAAIRWIAYEDDTEWTQPPQMPVADCIPSVTACLVADIYGKTIEDVTSDIRRELDRQDR